MCTGARTHLCKSNLFCVCSRRCSCCWGFFPLEWKASNSFSSLRYAVWISSTIFHFLYVCALNFLLRLSESDLWVKLNGNMQTVYIAAETERNYAKLKRKKNENKWVAHPTKTPVLYCERVIHTHARARKAKENMNQVIIILEKVPILLCFFVWKSFFLLLLLLVVVCRIYPSNEIQPPSQTRFGEVVLPFFIRITQPFLLYTSFRLLLLLLPLRLRFVCSMGDNTFNKILLWNFRRAHSVVYRGRQAQMSDKTASLQICPLWKQSVYFHGAQKRQGKETAGGVLFTENVKSKQTKARRHLSPLAHEHRAQIQEQNNIIRCLFAVANGNMPNA